MVEPRLRPREHGPGPPAARRHRRGGGTIRYCATSQSWCSPLLVDGHRRRLHQRKKKLFVKSDSSSRPRRPRRSRCWLPGRANWPLWPNAHTTDHTSTPQTRQSLRTLLPDGPAHQARMEGRGSRAYRPSAFRGVAATRYSAPTWRSGLSGATLKPSPGYLSPTHSRGDPTGGPRILITSQRHR
jgi:hypothetical protein